MVPHIGENGTVRLEVEQEVSGVKSSKGQAQDLVTSKRAIKTSILAEHGQTIVLGGLISDNTAYSRQAVPGLGAIPGLGRLFRSDGKSNQKRNLLIFIHPTIVGDQNDIRRISQQRYSQLYSLQLALDQDGNFAKLPERVEDIYQQRVPVSKTPLNQTRYQQVPSATPAAQSGAAVVTTPVAVEPALQRQTLSPQVSNTTNTTTTTTLRPRS